ncbi:MAG: nickel pincer cofactor biosynthesis protein LarC [Pirellulaceae bacterium]|nr:nickel pincer cofactor biosynthesis protein LarC [Pirellulaceae bacterium]
MKIGYLDCHSGISGDMMLGALVDVGVPLEVLQNGIDSLGLPSCQLTRSTVMKNGFRATKIGVDFEPENAHRHLSDITRLIDSSKVLSPRQKELATNLFTEVAKAEAKVHGTTLEKVHFHEVGAVDSIADVVAAAIGWDWLGVEKIVSSPIPTGSGKVKIAHGLVSVPAPATLEILAGIPLGASPVEAELTTPTGAAIVKVLATEFGPIPPMCVEAIGYGAGTRDFKEQANILRLIIGEATEADNSLQSSEALWQLETNLDDISPEIVGYVQEKLFALGALDVYSTPIFMKKNRPALMLTALVLSEKLAAAKEILFTETCTLGIRQQLIDRDVLRRESCQIETKWGKILGKIGYLPGGEPFFTPEYESCQKIAAQESVPLWSVYEVAKKGWSPKC